ncbi:MAG: DUF3418 domain-containing protein [Comamonadaceae bacterium]|nr:DUF3418 domain-containing protein [Comamonadaceae bacterium]
MRGARAQGAPAGRAGRRRADLRLLRPAAAGRRVLGARASSAGTARRSKRAARSCCSSTREELMRHEAAGITTDAFPKTVRLGGIDCAATYLHEPGDAEGRPHASRVPIYALNQVSEERCEWLVPGMLHGQGAGAAEEPARSGRARGCVPLPEYRRRVLRRRAPFAPGRACSTRC